MRNGLLGYALGLVLFLFSVGLLDARSQTTASGGTVVVAAGDISCDPNNSDYNNGQGSARRCRMKATSDLAVSMNPSAVLILGDTQYERGALDAFQKSWINNWGRKELKDMTYPSVGNHDTRPKMPADILTSSVPAQANVAKDITALLWELGTLLP